MAVCSASVDDGARNPFRASTARRDQLRLAAEVIARSRCVSVLSRSHQPVGDCRGTPSPNAKLVLVAFRTRLIAMKNIRSRSAGGGDMDPYSSAAHDQCKIGSLLSNASTKGLIRGSVCRRGSAERKSESRPSQRSAKILGARDLCTLDANIPTLSSGPSFATRAMPFPKSEAFRFPSSLTYLRSPVPGRRQPVKAASREAGARHAPALTGWRWSGLLGLKQARLAFQLTAPTLATVRMTSQLRRLAWRCRRCAARCACRARAATARG